MSIFHKKIKKKINELEELYITTKSKLMHEQDYCNQLNNLLTQKDKDIADLTLNLTKEKERSKRLNYEAQKYYEDAYCNNFQNEKAITELNNILDTFAFFVNGEKESIVSPDENGNLSLLEYIENRIDTLKGEPKC